MVTCHHIYFISVIRFTIEIIITINKKIQIYNNIYYIFVFFFFNKIFYIFVFTFYLNFNTFKIMCAVIILPTELQMVTTTMS